MTLQVDDATRGRVVVPVAAGRALRIAVETTDDHAVMARRAIHADLIRRVAERRGAVVSVFAAGAAPAPRAAELTSWGCRPLDDALGRAHLAVGDGTTAADITCRPHDAGAALPAGAAARFAVLSRDLAGHDAADEVRRWQQAVAQWAEQPSKPMCADYVAACDAALDDNLDVPRVIALMREVESHPELPPGSKFETFVDLDRLLAVELTARVGLPR